MLIIIVVMEETNLDLLNLAKPLPEDNTFSRSEIVSFASGSANLRDRALFATLYLTNSRVSEIVKRMKKRQILFTELKGKKVLLFTELWTQKNPDHPLRTVPVIIEKEQELVKVISLYISLYKDSEILFNISRQQAWYLMKRLCGQRCHYLRHSRITHLVVVFGINPEIIRRMAGWKDYQMLEHYSHLSWKDIASSMF